jgi:hypothetical protein
VFGTNCLCAGFRRSAPADANVGLRVPIPDDAGDDAQRLTADEIRIADEILEPVPTSGD